MDQSVRTFNVTEYFENLGGYRNFHAMMRVNSDGVTWSLYIVAHGLEIVDIATTYAPHKDMERIFSAWLKKLSEHEKFL